MPLQGRRQWHGLSYKTLSKTAQSCSFPLQPCLVQARLPLSSSLQSFVMYLRTALLSLSALAVAKELPKDEEKGARLYDSGIMHQNNIALKEVWRFLPARVPA